MHHSINLDRIITRIALVIALGAMTAGLSALSLASSDPASAGPAPGTSTLYVGNNGNFSITSYGQPAGGDQAPASTITSVPGPFGAISEAFDASHDLWVANNNNQQINEYTPSQLGANGAPIPNVTITDIDLDDPLGMAFDGAGNLWVSAEDEIVEIAAAQLAHSGNVTPAITLSDTASSIVESAGLAFDASGDLWAANSDSSTNTVVEFQPGQLTDGSPVPHVTISSSSGSLDEPDHIAFDASHNLWVADSGNNKVVEFLAAHLGGGATPADSTITSNASSLSTPQGLAFSSGNLWVANASGGKTVEYLGSVIGGGGSLVPQVTLTPSPAFGSDLAFDASGNLWAPSHGGSVVVELLSGQLASTGSPAPDVVISEAQPSQVDDPYGMAVDASGNLWEANYEGSTVNMYTPAQLNAGGSPAPTVVLSGIVGSAGLGFDLSGDLWVANYGEDTLSEYTPSQLAASGSPTPTVVLTSNGADSLAEVEEVTFDTSGDLWVTNAYLNAVEEFTPSQLAANGSPTPAITISTNGSHSLDYPTGIAFDRDGNLWVANEEASTLVAFSPAQLDANGSPAPAITLSPDGSSPAELDEPWQLQFDGSGELWVTEGGNAVSGFTPNQLSASGSPVPTNALAGSSTGMSEPTGLAIAQPNPVTATGYWLVASDGGIFTHGNTAFFGSQGATPLNKPIVGMAATPDGQGYWLVASDGGIFTHGDAQFYGSQGATALNKPIVGMAATPDGQGYWLVASDGGIFTHGDAQFYGSQGATALNKPIVGMAATPDGKGYWLVASDGGIFTHGDAQFYGSQGATALNKPIVGMAATPDGQGYWLVASDGGIFTHGDAGFFGSQGATPLNKPIVGMEATPDGLGYWLVASDGGIFTHGDAGFFGSQGATPLNKPIVGMG